MFYGPPVYSMPGELPAEVGGFCGIGCAPLTAATHSKGRKGGRGHSA
eukprot:CAMPEP_0179175724 /NCGR_PEP_ID=MMETSP0796-20121207/86806_1 /TAXON_ID=73915 /ORGANISM="Pyrodinium bahamense, Strain pbaha01" /LENGTH=46 /DNA_ID= /DNA_START= /DNA_END= /DNA_ORIENTATION=